MVSQSSFASLAANCSTQMPTKAEKHTEIRQLRRRRPRTHTHAPRSLHTPAHIRPAGRRITHNGKVKCEEAGWWQKPPVASSSVSASMSRGTTVHEVVCADSVAGSRCQIGRLEAPAREKPWMNQRQHRALRDTGTGSNGVLCVARWGVQGEWW